MKRLLLVCLFSLLACCAAKAPPKEAADEPEVRPEDMLEEGAVVEEAVEAPRSVVEERIVGTILQKKDPVTPVPFLKRKADGAELRLRGEALEELAHLAGGIEVQVECQLAEGKECFVLDYRILRTESGARPLVGIVVEEGDALYLETRLPLLEAAKGALQGQIGNKLYVEPEWGNNSVVRVKRYGLLRAGSGEE